MLTPTQLPSNTGSDIDTYAAPEAAIAAPVPSWCGSCGSNLLYPSAAGICLDCAQWKYESN